MNSVEEIKNYILQNIQLDTVVGEMLSLKKQSGRLVGCCPFHEENTPSFFVFDNNYHCFGCGAHGDVISFVREKQGLGFIDALRWFGEKYSFNCEALDQNKGEKSRWKKKIANNHIFSISQHYFRECLGRQEGLLAFQYLMERGFTKQQIEDYQFGFASSKSSALMRYLQSQGVSKEDIKECSLGNCYEGKDYDFFRNRITIPIRDIYGKIIAFGGRTLPSSTSLQKYKNSRYDKSSVLFGLYEARDVIRKKSRAIVVEGYLDAIKLWSCGFKEAVACQGTVLTKQHITSLKNQTQQVYLLFDGDEAGKRACLRVFRENMIASGISFHVVSLPSGEDPDSFVTTFGVAALEGLIQQSKALIEYVVLHRMQDMADQDTPRVVRDEFIPWLNQLDDPIKKAYLLGKIALYSGISQTLLEQELAAPAQGRLVEKKTVSLERDPEPYIKDLAGHLYYADPVEIDYEEINYFCQKSLSLSTEWGFFFEELLGQLKEGKPPRSQPFLSLHSDSEQSSSLQRFFLNLQKTSDAFRCKSRNQLITKIMLLHKKKILNKRIKTLKNQVLSLRLLTEDELVFWQKIVGQIQVLNQEIDQLDLQIKLL